MKIFYDCEFNENGSIIDLISIGMVREDGKELYYVNSNCNWHNVRANQWLMNNVWPSLPLEGEGGVNLDIYSPLVIPKAFIANKVKDFILEYPSPQLWAYYSAYDHVALCQLFGKMIDLPHGIPMYTHDLKCELMRHENEGLYIPPQAKGHHNALEDARHNLLMAKYLGLVT